MSRHLAIEIADRFVSFNELLDGNSKRSAEHSLSGRTDQDIKDELNSFFKEHGITPDSFDEITVSAFTKETTLVPTFVFGDTNAKDVFRLCFGEIDPGMQLDFNRIPEHGLVNVFSIQEWIKSFFVLRFPRVVVQHSGSHLIRAVLDKNAFKTKVGIHLYDQQFLLTITKHDKLEYYSYFDHNAVDDILYHMFFVLQQKELGQDTGTILISSGVGSDAKLPAALVDKINKVNDLRTFSIEVVDDLHSKSQLLCV